MSGHEKITSYKNWKPAMTVEEVFSGVIAMGNIKTDHQTDNLFWLETRPAEKGRIVLMNRDEQGNIETITPEGFYLRTRVHEYGGSSYIVGNNRVYFTNFADQRIYYQDLSGDRIPKPVTPAKNSDGSLGKYAALQLTSNGKLVFVYEKEYQDRENLNFIAAIDTTTENQEPVIIASGNDFYGEPVLSPDNKKIAWVTWNHPNMPWENTELVVADFDANEMSVSNEMILAGGNGKSICHPAFDSDGQLFFIMDEPGHEVDNSKNWWNIYSYNFNSGKVKEVTEKLIEFGTPMWGLGASRYAFLDNNRIAVIYRKKGFEYLSIFDCESSELQDIDLPFTLYYSILTGNSGIIYFIAAGPRQPAALYSYDLEKGELTSIKTSCDKILADEDVSSPDHIIYPTSDGREAHGNLYLPVNSQYSAPDGELPALIVMVHGGPTGCAKTEFSLAKQYWTSQGYAIFDVDHRGSTGYGRQYRDDLYGKWGIIDALDIKEGVEFLRNEGIVSDKAAIRGGSAGGYAVQRAMTLYPDLFQCGASYFGIGNLFTLVKLTHKFESRYLNSVVGAELPGDEEIFKERSPINYIDRLKSPMIIFQGADDKIVTPENSREMVRILEKRGIEHEYHEYEGEAHGFRMKENNIDSLNHEAVFFRKVLF